MSHPRVSVILPVYNVEAYLRECLDSIIGQTMPDFELICIDDGSTDLSGRILDEYAAREPRMRVVHRENAGVSSARNEGLDLARGEYLYLCDADDVCHSKLLAMLCGRIQKDHAEIVCCERESFDCATGRRMGRICFPEWVWKMPSPFSGESIGDGLLYAFGSSTCDKLLSREFVENNHLRYQTDVKRFALFYFTAMALALAERISLVPRSLYRYRENRPGGLQSTREQSPMDVLKARRAFMDEMKRRGKFSRFELGFVVSLVRVGRVQLRNTRNQETRTAFTRGLVDLVEEVVKRPGFPMMDFALHQEYAIWRELAEKGDSGRCRYDTSIRVFDTRWPVALAMREKYRQMRGGLARLFDRGNVFRRDRIGMRIRLDFLRAADDGIVLEGVVFCDRADAADAFASLELVVTSGVEDVHVRLADDATALDRTSEYGTLVRAWRFASKFTYPFAGFAEYRWSSSVKGVDVSWRDVEYSRYFPLTRLLRFSYVRIGDLLFSVRGDVLIARPATMLRIVKAETLLCLNLLRKHSCVALKALVLKLLIGVLRKARRRPLWLFSDRIDHADDNGRAMFEYVASLPTSDEPPECVFGISRRAKEAAQIRRFGRVVDIESFKYKIAFLLSDCVVSAYHTRMHRFPFDDRFAEYAKDLVLRPRFMLLRHGVCQNDTSRVQNRWFDDASFVATVSVREQASMTAASYGYTAREIRVTGFPRYDLLEDNAQKIITFMPTWRKELIEWDEKGRHKPSTNAARSSFVRMYCELLSDTEFIGHCERAGFSVQVKAHPNLSPVLPLIRTDSRVRFLDKSKPYREVFAETSLLVTDYSSVAFDFAYLRKPVIYFQFDKAEYFGTTYDAGYFDCVRDGFGPVVSSVEELKLAIIATIEGGCNLHPEYRGRIDAFFAFDDRENRRRVYEAILAAANRP